METLLGLVHKLSKTIEKIDQKANRDEFICKTVGLASFFQFHFMDIHPFSDGNGRMCRLLSKMILDSIFPIPIPMFENRERYLLTLIAGRELNHLLASTKLVSLIFDVSIDYYKGIVKYIETPIYMTLVSTDEEKFGEKVEMMQLEQVKQEEIKEVFKKMKPENEQTVNIPFKFYDGIKIVKLMEIDFDSL